MSSAAERMSRVDTAWLRMDNDVNLMMIVGVWILEPAVTLQAVRGRAAERLLRFDRFRQRAVADALGANWVDADDFDIDRHVVGHALECERGHGERQALQDLCGRLAGEALDPTHPLWQFHVIERYGAGSAIVMRIHHCIADGIALIGVMNSITDGGAEPPPRPRRAPGDADEHDWLLKAVLEPLTEAAVKAVGLAGSGMAKSIEMLAHPEQPLQESLGVLKGGLQVLQDAAALAFMGDDSPTLLKGRPDGRKVVAWNEPMGLDAVKAIGKGLGCSVNDVLLACVAGAIGSYLRDRGDDPTGKEIRAMVPVNLRPPDDTWQLGNRFGLAPLVLPVGLANPIERVYAVRRRMAELKGSYQPLLAFAILAATGLFVKPVQDFVLGLFAKKTTAVMTNVPGPPRLLQFCGATIRQTMFWVPASGEVAVGVSVLSVGGLVQFGVATDAALCPDPQAIVERFEPEFEKLLWLTMMLPWGGQDGEDGEGG